MESSRVRYNFINIAVLLLAAIFFISEYNNIGDVFRKVEFLYVFIIVIAAFIVHMIKAGRLYLALYGAEMSFMTYLKIYCKVTLVSVVLPLKLGDCFRMYCYGKQLKNGLKGIVIVLFDRFIDTLALVSIVFVISAFSGGNVTPFMYVLLLFLVSVMLVYSVFPRVYKFWNKYILRAKATSQKLAVLKVLNSLNHIYQEILYVTRGKGIVLFFMSLIAWAVEIGYISILDKLFGDGELSQTISVYLISVMNNKQSVKLKQFIVISVLMMLTIYIIVKVISIFLEKRITDENNNYI